MGRFSLCLGTTIVKGFFYMNALIDEQMWHCVVSPFIAILFGLKVICTSILVCMCNFRTYVNVNVV